MNFCTWNINYEPKWLSQITSNVLKTEEYCQEINQALTKAVEKRLMCDVPFGGECGKIT